MFSIYDKHCLAFIAQSIQYSGCQSATIRIHTITIASLTIENGNQKTQQQQRRLGWNHLWANVDGKKREKKK